MMDDTDLTDHHGEAEALRKENERLRRNDAILHDTIEKLLSEGAQQLARAEAAAALARRDAAMRNEGRRQAAGIVEAECTRVLSKQDGILPEVDRTLRMMCILLPDISASILAALEPEGGE